MGPAIGRVMRRLSVSLWEAQPYAPQDLKRKGLIRPTSGGSE
jgi:hypothetical protein